MIDDEYFDDGLMTASSSFSDSDSRSGSTSSQVRGKLPTNFLSLLLQNPHLLVVLDRKTVYTIHHWSVFDLAKVMARYVIV